MKSQLAYESKQKQLNGGSSEVIREVESSDSSLVESNSVIELPPVASRTRGWWHSLSGGSGERQVSAEVAKFVLDRIRSCGPWP